MFKYFNRICLINLTLLCLLIFLIAPFSSRASEPIKVAFIFSQTGIAINENIPGIEGARLAVDEINGHGGVLGRPIEMILLDNQSSPLRSKIAAQEAVKRNVTAVIGAMWSSHSLAIASILQEAKIPMITPASTKPEVTRTGDYIFRACFIDSFQGEVMAKFAYSDLGGRTSIVMGNLNEEYSLALAEYFEKSFKHMGGKVLYRGNYKGKAVDFKNILMEAKKFPSDVFFIPGYSRDSGLLINQAVKMGIKTTFLGGDGWDGPIYRYAGSSLNGSFFSNHWHPNVASLKSQHLQKMYRKKYGKKQIRVFVPLAYDSVMLLVDAIGRAGSLKKDKIRNALAQTKNYQGATGTINFDRNGDPKNKEASIIKCEKGKFVFLKTVRP
ncbi:MAG: ABC transporter substrate-binding protein [Desulfobacterales bacterium]|nr:ABC transporter substrate-binding protein [Deltaproteobacteria bacterium]NNL43584.1 ABC transporter substrate-binding protein [Desulfobacterales bacterium]